MDGRPCAIPDERGVGPRLVPVTLAEVSALLSGGTWDAFGNAADNDVNTWVFDTYGHVARTQVDRIAKSARRAANVGARQFHEAFSDLPDGLVASVRADLVSVLWALQFTSSSSPAAELPESARIILSMYRRSLVPVGVLEVPARFRVLLAESASLYEWTDAESPSLACLDLTVLS